LEATVVDVTEGLGLVSTAAAGFGLDSGSLTTEGLGLDTDSDGAAAASVTAVGFGFFRAASAARGIPLAPIAGRLPVDGGKSEENDGVDGTLSEPSGFGMLEGVVTAADLAKLEVAKGAAGAAGAAGALATGADDAEEPPNKPAAHVGAE